MMTDPVADMLTRIRNGAMARHDHVEMPHSALKESIALVLKSEGFVSDVRVNKPEPGTPAMRTALVVVLRYGRDKQSVIDGIRRISTPGRRVYVRHNLIPRIRSGMGMSILSTSRGVMTDKEAKKQRVGGELLCAVW